MKIIIPLAALVLIASPVLAAEEAQLFESRSGDKVEAFHGTFTVPENRADPKSRNIDIHYVRFPATGTKPGAPIVYLAGGPGGSGIDTAKGERFPLFMAMREFGDVIALDQRGTGLSETAPKCVSDVVIPMDRVVAPTDRNRMLRQAAEQCGAFWRAAGFDPAGYTTVESARDIDALRAHLGADKVTLWGISYGTHLALAAAKEMGPHIDRMVLASVEGLDQTVKLPSQTDAYFDRLQAAIDQEPAAKAVYPDIKGLMRSVHTRLDAEPVLLQVPTQDGPKPMLLTGEMMQFLASGSIADPQNAAQILMLYLAVDAGMTEPVAGLFGRFVTPGAPEEFRLMPLAMDIASGIGADRLARVEAEAKTAVLGDLLNYPMPQLAGALGLDLGDGFRAAPQGDMPILVLTGTLDGRTYPAEQTAAVSGLTRVTTVTVVNAGHNLFMLSPEVTQVISEFMRGDTPHTDRVTVPAPSFAPRM
ncbi:alpha/beta hydrolase [Asticcacaulis sp. AC460]|uniref:alpha/beta fold hydrolase n=1 Tax=Asticcacaulis sp. AC460 TaxID=1282360 RepID=UPI0003C3B5D0|nr:alpha/beta hydrolase [Asticcacaulis sp. AC460]ESQ89850.1 alpha/beta hydrolase [Asticcacaulis sp. AC460]